MKKLTFFAILVIVLFCTMSLLSCTLTYAAADQYKGGSGDGSAMTEYAGNLDGTKEHQQGKEAQYFGGAGSGSTMAECTVSFDDGKGQSQPPQTGKVDQPQSRQQSQSQQGKASPYLGIRLWRWLCHG